MSTLVGKTIARVDERAPSPWDGTPSENRIILFFTDETAVEFVGSGDDCDSWLSCETVSAEELAARDTKRAEHEAERREQALKRKAWLALTCEERVARGRPNANALLPDLYLRPMLESLGGTLVEPCPKCGERECTNAPARVAR